MGDYIPGVVVGEVKVVVLTFLPLYLVEMLKGSC